MGSFAVGLSETAPTWARAIAPLAERVSRTLWSTIRKPARQLSPATRLTQRRRRQAKGASSSLPLELAPRPPAVCRVCGAQIRFRRTYCASCAVTVSREGLIEAAKVGRVAGHSPKAWALQAEKQRRHVAAKRAWKASSLPPWLDEETYLRRIQPRLTGVTIPVISSAFGVSNPYAADIRAGRHRPHPRHWLALAQLVGVSLDD